MPPPIASIKAEVSKTLSPEIEALRQQLFESQAQAATLQATLNEFTSRQDTPIHTEIDYNRLVVAIQRLPSRTDLTDRITRFPSVLPQEFQSLTQSDLPLLFNR